MTVVRFEEIQNKFNNLEKKNIENQTEIKTINKRLKEEFDCGSIESAQELLVELNEKIKKDDERLKTLTGEIESITDWDKIDN